MVPHFQILVDLTCMPVIWVETSAMRFWNSASNWLSLA
jgi:hypothetical protein